MIYTLSMFTEMYKYLHCEEISIFCTVSTGGHLKVVTFVVPNSSYKSTLSPQKYFGEHIRDCDSSFLAVIK